MEPVTHEATGSRSAEVVCDGQQGFRECKEIQDDGGGHHADFSGKLLENLLANGRR